MGHWLGGLHSMTCSCTPTGETNHVIGGKAYDPCTFWGSQKKKLDVICSFSFFFFLYMEKYIPRVNDIKCKQDARYAPQSLTTFVLFLSSSSFFIQKSISQESMTSSVNGMQGTPPKWPKDPSSAQEHKNTLLQPHRSTARLHFLSLHSFERERKTR